MAFTVDAFLAGAATDFFYIAAGSFLAARPGLTTYFSSSSLLLLESSSDSLDSGEESESSLLLLLEDSTCKTRRPLKAGIFAYFGSTCLAGAGAKIISGRGAGLGGSAAYKEATLN
jgi:hypothetical protein